MAHRTVERTVEQTALVAKLNIAHGALLRVHKELIDYEIARFEAKYSKIGTPGEVLQIVIHDPWFAWLRPMTALITQIDEFVSTKESLELAAGEALLAEAKRMMVPGEGEFGANYFRAIQESPEVAWAQGEWRRIAGG